jgi:hypothetical protein
MDLSSRDHLLLLEKRFVGTTLLEVLVTDLRNVFVAQIPIVLTQREDAVVAQEPFQGDLSSRDHLLLLEKRNITCIKNLNF